MKYVRGEPVRLEGRRPPPPRIRLLTWSGADPWRAESALVDFGEEGLRATGVQLGVEPVPFRLDYRLEAPRRFITTELELLATGEGWQRRLLLRHDEAGSWQAETRDEGRVPLAAAGGELPDLSEALDCDIAESPLTNTMPVLRHGLDRAGSQDFLMAWISVPDLRVLASPQRYEHLTRGDGGSVVRYLSRGGDFTADLELDADGLVVVYPGMARRVEPSS